MARNDFAGALRLLPSTFREVYSHPKISEQIKAIGRPKVKAMIQFQLGVLASLMTTGGNLTGPMTDFIADGLIDQFPMESIADIKLCIQRGAMGRYGSIQRMDGITIGEWIGKYLDEKYAELEMHIERRKNNEVAKEPIEHLTESYMAIRGEETKRQSVLAFNKREYERKYGKIDTEQIERLRTAEIEGRHVHKLPIGTFSANQYFPFHCDEHVIYATSEQSAKFIFTAALGREPKIVTLQGEERETPK